jgi:hypothetical protein
MDQTYSLESLIAPFLADLKADGHKLGPFSPALPAGFNPEISSPFSSEAACEVCGAFFVVEWEGQSFRVGGSILTADECKSGLRATPA